MHTRSRKILDLLSLPKYETTKGLSVEQRQFVIDATSAHHNLEDDCKTSESEDKTSGSEFIPPTSCEEDMSSTASICKTKELIVETPKQFVKKKKRNTSLNKANKICILQNVVLNGPTTTFDSVDTKPDKDFMVKKYFESIKHETKEIISDKAQTYQEAATSEALELQPNDNNLLINEKTDFKNKTQSPNISMKENNKEQRNSKESNGSTEKSSVETVKNVFRKKNFRNLVKIQAASKNNGKRIRDKKHVCYFCNKALVHMGRHFESVHAKELEIQKCLAQPAKSKERKQGFLEIIRVGDFYHNCHVLSTGEGELVLIRRPTENEAKFVSDYDYGPCPNCLGFLLKRHIWHHLRYSCKEKVSITQEPEARHVIAESNAIIADIHGFGFTKEFHNAIISKFRNDEIGDICRTDNLITKFGAMQFEKYGDTQNELIRQNMRQLARLTISLRKLTNGISCSLRDFLCPEKFDSIVQATKDISMNDVSCETFSRPDYHTPSLALKLGYSLKKCISIERGSALRCGNIKRNRVLLSLLHLMNMEWEIRISSNALSTLYRRKINANQLLPITNDLVKLSNYLDNHITIAKAELIKNRNNFSWTRLATLTLARIILFNKRRSGEAAKMKMSHYISRTAWQDQNTEEIKCSLTPFERKLAETLIVVEIEGKRGRKVPIILTPPVKESLDLLIRHRDEAKIYFRNKYIFARSNQSLSHLRGHDCLSKVCNEIALENPSLITGTRLRKYVATVCQIFNMTENQYDWLARHLGHDIRVHRDFYRMHESAIELTKVSRLLLAVDKGEVNKFAGKNIEDIEIKDLPHLDYEEDDDAVEDDKDEENMEEKYEENMEEKEREEISNKESTETNKMEKSSKVDTKRKKKVEATKKIPVPWTIEEKKAVLRFFQVKIKKGIVPGKEECEKCISENADLSKRDWKKIKFCVKNEISKIKKIKK